MAGIAGDGDVGEWGSGGVGEWEGEGRGGSASLSLSLSLLEKWERRVWGREGSLLCFSIFLPFRFLSAVIIRRGVCVGNCYYLIAGIRKTVVGTHSNVTDGCPWMDSVFWRGRQGERGAGINIFQLGWEFFTLCGGGSVLLLGVATRY